MNHTNNHDTPRTNEVDEKCRKFDGVVYWPGKMRDHARQLERELAAMTEKSGVTCRLCLGTGDAVVEQAQVT